MATTRNPQPNPAEEPVPTTPAAPAPAPTPAPAPAAEQHPAGEDVRVKRSFRERVSDRPVVTAGVAALVAFCVAGVGGFAIGHAVGDDHGPRESVARYDEGGMPGQNGPGNGGGYGFGDRSEQGPGGDRSGQGQSDDEPDQGMTERPDQGSSERPGQGSTETPDPGSTGDVPATPEQGGAAAQL